MRDFERVLKRPNIIRMDDSPYREEALLRTLQQAISARRPIALVDMLIRFMLDDVKVRVDCLLTYNVPDFADVCRKRNIQIL